MADFEREKNLICSMLESNGYGIRKGQMLDDDFRFFLTPPGIESESMEF